MASRVRKAKPRDRAPPIPPAPPLPPVPDNVALAGDMLCSVCASLELTPRRFIVWPDEPQYRRCALTTKATRLLPPTKFVPLALVTDVKKNTRCPLCRLLLVAVMGNRAVPDVDGKGRPLYIGISWGNDGRKPGGDHDFDNLQDIRAIFVSLVLGSGQDTKLGGYAPNISLLVNDAPANTPPAALRFLPRPARRDTIDFDLVRWWIAICEARHTPCDSSHIMREMGWESPQTAVPAFRCIDLEQDCLVLPRNVPVPANFKYAALSYVWGRAGSDDEFFKTLQANVAEREVPGFFASEESQSRLPATIRDAMTVARRIGIQYLWVDSLCIVQDGNGADWLDAIRKMDMVYGAAYIVICPTQTFSAFDGIDGLSPSRPIPSARDVEQIAEGFRLACREPVDADTETSEPYPYDSRGWTFQENHFASRILNVGDGVSFNCRSSEDLWWENRFEDTSWVTELPEVVDYDMSVFESPLWDYSSRQLSIETDIYRAFAGVARQVGRRLKCHLCHGLPTRFFDWFLLWQPNGGTPRRRTVAPSWSWAGWHDRSESRIWAWCGGDGKAVWSEIRKRTWIIWYQRVDHTSTRCVAVRRRRKEDEGKSLNMYGGEARKRERFSIDCSVTEPTARKLIADGLPAYTEDISAENPGNGFLQFWTVAAVFELHLVDAGDGGAHCPRKLSELPSLQACSDGEWSDIEDGTESDGDRDIDHDGDFETSVKLIIGGRSGHTIGRIYVPEWWQGLAEIRSSNRPCRKEFILLCEARDELAKDNDLIKLDGRWRYRVMLLEPKLEGIYYERIAIGWIELDSLKEAVGGLSWKEVILG